MARQKRRKGTRHKQETREKRRASGERVLTPRARGYYDPGSNPQPRNPNKRGA